jgi:signal transduction histidine kinase
MPRSPHRRTLVLFSVLAVYVLSQFLWWAYLLVEKDNELQALLGQLEALGVRSTIDHDRPERTLWMVAGEGSVFVTLLLLALWLTYRTVRHELGLARLQRNFLMAASHELRTPIAALKLGLQTMHRRELEAAQQHMLMSNAIGDVARLEGLSEKILLATRLEEVKLPVQWGSVDLAALLRSLAQQARMSYGKDHTISMEAPPALLVQSDEEGLRSIFGNLLENACKYAPQGSEVSLVLRHLNGGLVVEVLDEGPGVPVSDRERIFERFYRGGNEETRQAKGTGLGLYIVRRSAEELGATVTYRPRRPKGSIFAVAFPER